MSLASCSRKSQQTIPLADIQSATFGDRFRKFSPSERSTIGKLVNRICVFNRDSLSRSSSSYREIRPRPAPALPQPETKNEEKQRVRKPTKKTRRRVYGLTGTPNQPARRNETSAAKTPAMTSHDSATQSQGSRSCDYPPYNQESPPQASVEALQKALKAQVLHSLRVLRKIAMDHHALNLVPEIIDGWVADIEGVDAKSIPIASSMAAQIYGPMQKLTIRHQATELLKYILTYAEEYYLVQGSQVYLDIGRWIETLTKTNTRK
ncbi:unnamed protein product [Penicillium nalgiovense]|nr:unnamed protein product [Penicillium nalgiovense]